MSYFDNAKAVTFAGKAVSKLELAGRMIWEAVTLKNWVKLSTESDGQTIYNGGLGYKNGYRIRSGGAETTASNTACTGFIKVDPGDVIRLSGWDLIKMNFTNILVMRDMVQQLLKMKVYQVLFTRTALLVFPAH